MLRFNTYSCAPKRASKLQEQLYQQSLQNSNFCDVTLIIHDSIMKAHWCVLVGCPYFQSLYDSGMKESLSGKVVLNFGDSLSTRAAIEFLYTGEVHVNLDNVRSLLSVADYLQLSEMTELCERYLEVHTSLTLDNCVQVLLISSQFNMNKTYEHALKYVCGHLPELLSGSTLLDLTPVSLHYFITDPTLSYVHREDLFNFLVRWTEKDKDHRLSDFEDLFKALDLQLVSNEVLANTIIKHPLVAQSQPCQLHCMGAQVKGMVNTGPGQSHLRDVIVVGGGVKDINYQYQFVNNHKNASARLMAYFPQEGRWAMLPDMPYGIRKPVLCVTDQGKVLVANSSVDYPMLNVDLREKPILRYCPRANAWDTIKVTFPSTDREVTIHALLCLQGRLFAVTSSKNEFIPVRQNSRHNAKHLTAPAPIIRYLVQLLELDYSTNEFQVRYAFCQRHTFCHLRVVCQQAHSGPSLDGGVIYVMGNKLFSYKARGNQRHHTKLFCYDIKTGRGREVYGHKMACETLAYGFPDGFVSTRLGKTSCKMYQQDVGKVVTCKDRALHLLPGHQSREDFSTISLHDDIYIIGGKNATTVQTSKSAFKFSFLTKRWTELEPLPEDMLEAGIARGKMGMDVLRCHVECPHCYYQPFENKTQYQVDISQAQSVTDEEEEGSESYYDDSDYDFSYDWEEHGLLGNLLDDSGDLDVWGYF